MGLSQRTRSCHPPSLPVLCAVPGMLSRADASHVGELRPGLCTMEGPSPVEGWVCGESWVTWPAVWSCFACLPQAGVMESPWTLLLSW